MDISIDKRFIEISNLTEISVEALHLMGASDKRGDSNKIGMFGSGNKYSLAWLIRNKIEFHIFSGDRMIEISTIVKDFRSMKFNVITLNGKETSITDDLGKDWTKEFVIRELISNAIDEEGFSYKITNEVIPEVGFTKIYLDYNAFSDISLTNIFAFMRTDLPLYNTKELKVYSNKHNCIYRKGITVIKGQDYNNSENRKSLYDYDFSDIKMDESRKSSTYELSIAFRDIISNIPADLIYRIMTHQSGIEILMFDYIYNEFNDINFEEFSGKIIYTHLHLLLYDEPKNGVLLHPNIYNRMINHINKDTVKKFEMSFFGKNTSNLVYKVNDDKTIILNDNITEMSNAIGIHMDNVIFKSVAYADDSKHHNETSMLKQIICVTETLSDEDATVLAFSLAYTDKLEYSNDNQYGYLPFYKVAVMNLISKLYNNSKQNSR